VKTPPVRTVLPVIFLIDVSGSMGRHAKMESVNTAMAESLEQLDEMMGTSTNVEIKVNVLKFGCSEGDPCQWMCPEMAQLVAFEWVNLEADSNTPLGEAYFELESKLTRSEFMVSPSGSFAPVIILITDGVPSNRQKAKEGLEALRGNSWFTHAERMAIGVDMREEDDTSFLDEFVRGAEHGMVFREVANAASLISSIEGVVVNATMIGATRLKPAQNEYVGKLENTGNTAGKEEEESPLDPMVELDPPNIPPIVTEDPEEEEDDGIEEP